MRQAMILWLAVALACLTGLEQALAAERAGEVLFAWKPGEATIQTGTRQGEFRMAPGAQLVEAPKGKGVRPREDGGIGGADVRLGAIPEQGTISFWINLSRTIRHCGPGEKVTGPLIHCEDLTIALSENDNGVSLEVRGGNEIRRPRVRGLARFDLTHLRADQWYHVAVTHDAPKGAWRLILNGVMQPAPYRFGPFRFRHLTTRLELTGRLAPRKDTATPVTVALGPVTWEAGILTPAAVLARLKDWKVPPNRGEGVLVSTEEFDGEALGGDVLFQERFDTPLDLKQWVLEGPARLEVKDGRLFIHNERHVVLWLKQRLPRDFVAAWDVEPSQVKGLTIVFIAAMGGNGCDLFDPTLKKRDGTFSQYIRGDIRSYHCSYWAGTRGSANMRKNPGFFIVGIGPDPIGRDLMAGGKGPWRVCVVRRGSRIDVAVNKQRFLSFTDDAKTYGPVHGAGYLGLRQMGNSRKVAYDNLVIRALKKAAK